IFCFNILKKFIVCRTFYAISVFIICILSDTIHTAIVYTNNSFFYYIAIFIIFKIIFAFWHTFYLIILEIINDLFAIKKFPIIIIIFSYYFTRLVCIYRCFYY